MIPILNEDHTDLMKCVLENTTGLLVLTVCIDQLSWARYSNDLLEQEILQLENEIEINRRWESYSDTINFILISLSEALLCSLETCRHQLISMEGQIQVLIDYINSQILLRRSINDDECIVHFRNITERLVQALADINAHQNDSLTVYYNQWFTVVSYVNEEFSGLDDCGIENITSLRTLTICLAQLNDTRVSNDLLEEQIRLFNCTQLTNATEYYLMFRNEFLNSSYFIFIMFLLGGLVILLIIFLIVIEVIFLSKKKGEWVFVVQ